MTLIHEEVCPDCGRILLLDCTCRKCWKCGGKATAGILMCTCPANPNEKSTGISIITELKDKLVIAHDCRDIAVRENRKLRARNIYMAKHYYKLCESGVIKKIDISLVDGEINDGKYITYESADLDQVRKHNTIVDELMKLKRMI